MINTSVAIVIPARRGSKGLPGKNTVNLAGRPMIEWSVLQAAREAGEFEWCRIIVTTDDPDVEELGAMWIEEDSRVILIRRPPYLCDDEVLTDPVLVHAVEACRATFNIEPTYTVLLQPTSPLRPKGIVRQCVTRCMDFDCDSVLTVHKGHFVWNEVNDGNEWRAVCSSPRRPRRQALTREEKRWIENGNCYAVKTEMLLKTQRRLTGNVKMIEIPKLYGTEVDEPEDLDMVYWAIHRTGSC